MPSERERDALEGIKQNIEAIRSFTEGMRLEDFASDLRTYYAVTRALEIISEASRRLSDDVKDRYPDVPWRAIRDAGNFYRHAYARIATRLIWETAAGQLEGLQAAVAQELGPADPEPPKSGSVL